MALADLIGICRLRGSLAMSRWSAKTVTPTRAHSALDAYTGASFPGQFLGPFSRCPFALWRAADQVGVMSGFGKSFWFRVVGQFE
jgi:hypothetical protein